MSTFYQFSAWCCWIPIPVCHICFGRPQFVCNQDHYFCQKCNEISVPHCPVIDNECLFCKSDPEFISRDSQTLRQMTQDELFVSKSQYNKMFEFKTVSILLNQIRSNDAEIPKQSKYHCPNNVMSGCNQSFDTIEEIKNHIKNECDNQPTTLLAHFKEELSQRVNSNSFLKLWTKTMQMMRSNMDHPLLSNFVVDLMRLLVQNRFHFLKFSQAFKYLWLTISVSSQSESVLPIDILTLMIMIRIMYYKNPPQETQETNGLRSIYYILLRRLQNQKSIEGIDDSVFHVLLAFFEAEYYAMANQIDRATTILSEINSQSLMKIGGHYFSSVVLPVSQYNAFLCFKSKKYDEAIAILTNVVSKFSYSFRYTTDDITMGDSYFLLAMCWIYAEKEEKFQRFPDSLQSAIDYYSKCRFHSMPFVRAKILFCEFLRGQYCYHVDQNYNEALSAMQMAVLGLGEKGFQDLQMNSHLFEMKYFYFKILMERAQVESPNDISSYISIFLPTFSDYIDNLNEYSQFSSEIEKETISLWKAILCV